MTQCTKGSTDSMVGQKSVKFGQSYVDRHANKLVTILCTHPGVGGGEITRQRCIANFALAPLSRWTRLVLAPAVVWGRTQPIRPGRGVSRTGHCSDGFWWIVVSCAHFSPSPMHCILHALCTVYLLRTLQWVASSMGFCLFMVALLQFYS